MEIYALTWNIKAGRDAGGSRPCGRKENLNTIAGTIADCGADIACLQEVDLVTLRCGRIDQAGYIAERLAGITGAPWQYEYMASIRMFPGRYGNAVLSRYPLTAVMRLPLPKRYGREDRSFILTRVDCGGELYAGAFHLGLKGDQTIQAAGIKRELYAHGFDAKRMIIGGDLNQGEGSLPYDIMLHHSFEMSDGGPRGAATLQGGVKADFWFGCGVPVDASCSRVLDIDISDHRPVMVCIAAD